MSKDPGGITGTYEVQADCTGQSTRYVPGLLMEPGPNVITVLLDRT